MIAPKLASPQAHPAGAYRFLQGYLDHHAIISIESPPGYLPVDGLVSILNDLGMQIVWLRLSPEDRDPGTLLLSLVDAVQFRLPEIGQSMQQEIQQHPGPIFGWPALYKNLAEEWIQLNPRDTVFVFDHVNHLLSEPMGLHLLFKYGVSTLATHTPCILISHEALPSADLPSQTVLIAKKDLQINRRNGDEGMDPYRSRFSRQIFQRLSKVSDGCETVLRAALVAVELLGMPYLEKIIQHSRNTDYLLAQLARSLLAAEEPRFLQALGLTLNLTYAHPRLIQEACGVNGLPAGPWVQELEGQWARIRCLWEAPLRKGLGRKISPGPAQALQGAEFLAQNQAAESAMRVFFELGEYQKAAQWIEKMSEQMFNLGQWATLTAWLDCLPPRVLRNYPELVYVRGELASTAGDGREARRIFCLTAEFFSRQSNPEGVCRSLLSSSALAAWEDDLEKAINAAQTAYVLASASTLERYAAWAAWQMGCLYATSNDLPNALLCFSQAAHLAPDLTLKAMFEKVELLVLNQLELHQEVQYFQAACEKLAQQEQEYAEQIRFLSGAPPDRLPLLLATQGWANLPLMIKLPAPEKPEQKFISAKQGLLPGIVETILFRFQALQAGSILRAGLFARSAEHPALEGIKFADKIEEFLSNSPVLPGEMVDEPGYAAISGVNQDVFSPRPPNESSSPETPPASTEKGDVRQGEGLVSVYLMGDFRIKFNEHDLDEWPSSRSLAVFKYLLAHPGRSISRDTLMDLFWPEVSPDAARNNLNVALHKLRLVLNNVSAVAVVLYHHGNYCLNPELTIWVDCEVFEQHWQAGRQLEINGQMSAAVEEYELAVNLYRGDFLAGDVYEDWTVGPRQRLQVLFLEILERLSRIYFDQGDYAQCTSLCQRILELDNCREDATCRLMCCYSRQGQTNLALRQYQVCVDALRKELDIEPEAGTTRLAERIRRKEQV